jgi:hypothetical protein
VYQVESPQVRATRRKRQAKSRFLSLPPECVIAGLIWSAADGSQALIFKVSCFRNVMRERPHCFTLVACGASCHVASRVAEWDMGDAQASGDGVRCSARTREVQRRALHCRARREGVRCVSGRSRDAARRRSGASCDVERRASFVARPSRRASSSVAVRVRVRDAGRRATHFDVRRDDVTTRDPFDATVTFRTSLVIEVTSRAHARVASRDHAVASRKGCVVTRAIHSPRNFREPRRVEPHVGNSPARVPETRVASTTFGPAAKISGISASRASRLENAALGALFRSSVPGPTGPRVSEKARRRCSTRSSRAPRRPRR